MRQMNRLTPLQVKNLAEPGRYADGGGLYLQISQWQTKAWLFKFMLNRTAHEMGLGSVNDFSLKDAREMARANRQLLQQGINPLAEKRKRQQEAQSATTKAVTFEAAWKRYVAAHESAWKNDKHRYQWRQTLTDYAGPVLGKMDVAAISTDDVLRVLEPLWNDKTETAVRLRGRIEAVLDWAAARGYRSGENPARWKGHLAKLLPAPTKIQKVSHQASMPYENVPALMVDLQRHGSNSAKALEMTILSATRTSETILATWNEFDFDAKIWTIDGVRTKTGQEHRVPLTDRAIEILKSLPREKNNPFVFPGGRIGKPLSNMAMMMLLRDLRPDEGWTVHGFRSSFRTWAAEQTNFPREICEGALAHKVENKVERAYQRSDVLEKRRKLLQAWEGYCKRPKENGAVIAMVRENAL